MSGRGNIGSGHLDNRVVTDHANESSEMLGDAATALLSAY